MSADAGDEIAHLRDELQGAEEREAAVRDVIQTIAQPTFDLDRVLQTVIDRAVSLCHAHSGNIARQEGDVYRVVAFTSMTPEYQHLVRERIYVPERGSVIGRTVLERRVVQIADVLDDPDYALMEIQGGRQFPLRFWPARALSVPKLTLWKQGQAYGRHAIIRTTSSGGTGREVVHMSGVVERAGPRVFRLIGEFDPSNVGDLDALLEPEISGDGDLMLDLSELTFMDSVGMGLLALASERLGGRGSIILLSPDHSVRRVLELMALDRRPNVRIVDADSATG